MGTCLSKFKSNNDNKVQLLSVQPLSNIHNELYACYNNNDDNKLSIEVYKKSGKTVTNSNPNDETVESLLANLFAIYNQRCPHCKKYIKSCSKTEYQVRHIFSTLQDKIMKFSNASCNPLLFPTTLSKFATIRRSFHEKRFLSIPLQIMCDIIQTSEDSNVKIGSESQEVSRERDEDNESSMIEGNYHYQYSNNLNRKDLYNLAYMLMEETEIPLCLSGRKYNKEIWG